MAFPTIPAFNPAQPKKRWKFNRATSAWVPYTGPVGPVDTGAAFAPGQTGVADPGASHDVYNLVWHPTANPFNGLWYVHAGNAFDYSNLPGWSDYIRG